MGVAKILNAKRMLNIHCLSDYPNKWVVVSILKILSNVCFRMMLNHFAPKSGYLNMA